jgi:type IV pilus assembly protein PilA
MKICPACSEESQDSARICPWCHGDLTTGGPSTPQPAIFSGQPQNSSMAIGSLITGIFFFILPSAIAAVILGHMSRADILRSQGRKKGEGMALAGLVLGYTGIALMPIVIIAALVMPNLIRSRMAANEVSALASLRTLTSAMVQYNSIYGTYPPNFAALGPPPTGEQASARHAGLVDAALLEGTKAGYVFHYEAFSTRGTTMLDTFQLTAEPEVPNQTGTRYYFADQSDVIRFASGARADESSSPLQP